MTAITADPARSRIPIFPTAFDAYRLGLGAVFSSGKMLRFFVYGSVLWISAVGFKYYGILLKMREISYEGPIVVDVLVAMLFALFIAIVQTPLGIVLQRWILLGESPKASYFAYVISPAGRRYALAAFLVQVIFLCAALFPVLTVVVLSDYVKPDNADFAAIIQADEILVRTKSLLLFLLYLVATWLSIRLAFAFPVAACGPQLRWIRQSVADTKGTTARLFLVYVLISLPMIGLCTMTLFAVGVVYAVRHMLQGQKLSSDPGSVSQVFLSPEMFVGGGIMAVALAIFFVAIATGAARAYQIRLQRGPSDVAGQSP